MSATMLGSPSGLSGKVVFVGAPFDHGSSSYPGCAGAPGALRALTAGLGAGHEALIDKASGKRVLEAGDVSDAGDLPYSASMSREVYLQRIETAIAAIVSEGRRPFLLGGDHLVTLPALFAMGAAYEEFQVVQLDAHTDFHPEVKADSLPTHSNFMFFATGIRELKRVTQVGVRGFSSQSRPRHERFATASPETLANALLPGIPVYLTVDTDGFDPLVAGAVGHPEPGGLQWADLDRVLEAIAAAGCELLGADWTELNPAFDTRNQLTGRHVAAAVIRITRALARQGA